MKIGMLKLAILILVSVNAKPLVACQPEHISNFIFELGDGQHVFAMKYYEDVAFEYPSSGVYRKGPDKELVWEYYGFFSGSDLTNSFSSTGQYLVEANFHILEEDLMDDPRNDQRVVLSVYDQGKLIGEFTRETFIHGASLRKYVSTAESSEPTFFRCGPWLWGHMKYDKLIDQIRVRSKAKRTVVIDVPTAEILYVDDY